eukprot:1832769-Ditylum_brightwellii.AAC.1
MTEPDLVHCPVGPHDKDVVDCKFKVDSALKMNGLQSQHGKEDTSKLHTYVASSDEDTSGETDESQATVEVTVTEIVSPTSYTKAIGSTVSRRGRKRSPVAAIPSPQASPSSLPSSSRRGRKRSFLAPLAPSSPSAPPPVTRSSPHWKDYIASLVHAIPLRNN